MNKNITSSKKRKNKFGFVFFIICVIGLLIMHNLDKDETDEIYNNPDFSIGLITQFFSSRPTVYAPKIVNQPGQSSMVHFKFSIDSINYEMTQSAAYYTYTPSDSVEIGEKYLVIYHKKQPEMCRILFDCPIRDSSDFRGYIDNKGKILADKKHNKHIKPDKIEKN